MKTFLRIKKSVRARRLASIMAEIDNFDDIMDLTSRANELNLRKLLAIIQIGLNMS